MVKKIEEFQAELTKRFPYNSIEILEYNGASKKIIYKCNICGRIYQKVKANHLYESKTLCQKCYSGRESKIKNKFLNYLKKRPDLELLSQTICISEKAKIRCLKCQRIFFVSLSNFVTRADHSCPFCGKNGAPIDQLEMERRMTEIGKNDYELIGYKNFTTKVKIRHKKCNFIFNQLPVNFLKGRGCPKCYGTMSIGEQKIEEFLSKNKIIFERQKKFEETGEKRFDFYIPEKKTLIEYQGEQHYSPIEHFGGEKAFEIRQKRDEEKRNFCKKYNYKLIEIPYYHQNILSQYLSQLIGSTTINIDSSELKEN